jgi:hypothetical protein
MARFDEPTEPMTLGNMRANGVRSLAVSCHKRHHRAIMSADQWQDNVPVPAFGLRMGVYGLRHHRRRRAAGSACDTVGGDVCLTLTRSPSVLIMQPCGEKPTIYACPS